MSVTESTILNSDPSLRNLTEAIGRKSAEVGGRILVAIAGPPGVGKSTFTDALRDRLNAQRPGRCEVLPMDGFHYDDLVLEARGDRPRKGAPHTFDVEGLHHMLRRLREAAGDVAVPVFDRSIEIARAGARIIGPSAGVILVEGNYLLLDDPRWAPLRDLFDLTVMLEAPFSTIEERLHERWRGLDGQALRQKLEDNDLPNARLVLERSVAADFIVENAGLMQMQT